MEKLDEIIKERKKFKISYLASALDSIPTDQNKSIQSYTKGIEFANLEEIQKDKCEYRISTICN